MNKIKILLLILIASSNIAWSQIRLSLKSSDYKNETLYFYTISDYISQLKDTILTVKTNAQGGFDSQVKIKHIKNVFVDLGVYHCFIYLDPKTPLYLIRLPQKRNKSKAEELNIFFQATEYPIAILNAKNSELNKLILTYDKINSQFIKDKYDSIYFYPRKKLISDFHRDIKNYYSEVNNRFFSQYLDYSVYNLYYAGPHRDYRTITRKFYNNKNILYNNPSYMALFNVLYDNFFATYKMTKEGAGLSKAVKYARSVKELKRSIKKDASISNEQLSELILLKGIHDEFYNRKKLNTNPLPIPQLDIILDSVAHFSRFPEHRKIAKNIQNKKYYARNKRLSQAPEFALKDLNGKTRHLNEFLGKYIYLNFQRSDVLPSMESMDRMIPLHQKYKDQLEIISIFTDSIDSKKVDTERHQWPILQLGNNKNLSNFYNQITWPQFYLIDPTGKIIAFPAKSPNENFGLEFSKLIAK